MFGRLQTWHWRNEGLGVGLEDRKEQSMMLRLFSMLCIVTIELDS